MGFILYEYEIIVFHVLTILFTHYLLENWFDYFCKTLPVVYKFTNFIDIILCYVKPTDAAPSPGLYLASTAATIPAIKYNDANTQNITNSCK